MLRLKPATFAVWLLPLALAACGDASSTDDPRTQPPLVRSATVVSAVDSSRAFTGVVVADIAHGARQHILRILRANPNRQNFFYAVRRATWSRGWGAVRADADACQQITGSGQ